MSAARANAAAIRPAAAADLPGLLALYHELAEGDAVRSPGAASVSEDVLAAILADPGRHLVVAMMGERLAGTADMLIVPNLTHHAQPWAVIENVAVTAAARRQGIATARLDHLTGIAAAAGCYKIQLLSGKQRTGAHALYRKTGFQPLAEGFRRYFDGTRPSPPS